MSTIRLGKMMGFSLIELMVALVLGLILILGVTTMVTNSSSSYRELARASAQVENGRYAIQLLVDDLNHAGFYGGYFSITEFPSGVAEPSACALTKAVLDKTIALAVQGYKGGATVPTTIKNENNEDCIVANYKYQLNTDILLVRRAATDLTSPKNLSSNPGRLFLQSHTLNIDGFKYTLEVAENNCDGNKAKFGKGGSDSQNNNYFSNEMKSRPNFNIDCTKEPAQSNPLMCVSANNRDCFDAGVSGDIRALVANLYFISQCDVCSGANADTVPTLKKRELTAAGFSAPISLVRGIEAMRFVYGVDDNPASGDGEPDRFVEADGVDNGGGFRQWSDVVTVEIFLLARNEEPTPGYTDTKAYVMGLDADTDTIKPGGAFKRHLYRTKVRLNNVSDRRL